MGLIFGGIGVWLLFLPEPTSKLIAAIFIGVGILLGILLSATTRIFIDRGQGVLRITYQYLYRLSQKEIPLNDLAAIEIQTSNSSDSGATHRLVFILHSGVVIPLHSYYSSGFLGKERMAQRLRQAIGLSDRVGPAVTTGQAVRQIQREIVAHEESGESDGVRWRLETIHYGAVPVSRWISPDYTLPGDFLLLAQKARGKGGGALGGLLDGLSSLLFRQLISMYGFQSDETPGLENARLIEGLDSRLEPYFSAYTSNPERASRLLHPWVIIPLVDWAMQRPIQTIASEGSATGQLVFLVSPRGVTLALFNANQPETTQELAAAGTEIVKSLRSIPA